ncbi:MAG TPA: hypothetical protein VF815_45450 [Myxococcaceae bacterium]|jgi:hypothetical protein
MASIPVKTVLLGCENDERLRRSLNDVVLRLGAKQVTHECAVGGPQAYERVEAEVRSKRLVIDAKTNAGISIFGPMDLVDEIQGMVQQRLSSMTPRA